MLSTMITGQFAWLWMISLAIASGALFHLALLFPYKTSILSKHPSLSWLGYLPPLLLAIVFSTQIIAPVKTGSLLIKAILSELLCLGVSGGIFLIILISNLQKSYPSLTHKQARICLWGIILTGLPAIAGIILSLYIPSFHFQWLSLLSLAFFPVYISYALLITYKSKHNAVQRKTLIYAILSALTILAYTLLVTGISLLVGESISATHPVAIGVIVFLLAISFNPVRSWLDKSVDGVLNQGDKAFQKHLQAFAQELTRNNNPNLIFSSLRRSVKDTLNPELIHIFILDPWSNHYLATLDESGTPTSDLRFPSNSALVRYLSEHNSSFTFEGNRSSHLPLYSERSRIALLGAILFVPLPGQKQMVGWLALGPGQSRDAYQKPEIAYLKSICNQAALAIERLQVISNLERRIREMDVLTRIAQGVNITLDFDNILELIYAQTNNVIPTRDFRITLSNPGEGKHFHAFFLENDERLAYNENITIPSRQGLEKLVIQNQRSMIIEDYDIECRNQGVIPDATGVIAWLGVPLHAGSQSIGCISVGSRDTTMVFTEQQRDLLQAIADQAAGAIIKSQLLSESDRRARQLATLNEIGRGLTSTLEINTLLKQIMNSAVELLNCEAGSLFTVEPETNEIAVEVTIGPGANDPTDTRLSAGTGVVDKVVESGQPVRINSSTNIPDTIDHFEFQSGFYQRDLLAVPMKVKETVVGVIEVINKFDGTPFDEDDQGILSTFSSQAAVALENARLYTQTDEALSARLEEMSVMQRIDRELNASLDVGRTMRITLDWSMNQSRSEAGLIGFVDQDEQSPQSKIRVIASKGFKNGPSEDALPGTSMDDPVGPGIVVLPAIQKVIRDGQPLRTTFVHDDRPADKYSSSSDVSPGSNAKNGKLSPWTKTQIIIPIRRKSDVIGILLLESVVKDSYSPDTTLFLTRLSDHAAIAISNALLFEDLQAANIAKSEFVSLVSHELKTPMTSIRGYADLLAQGTVGPINEIQGNFLNTIRSNVNRMSNLVSDLADVSRIEAGKMRLEFGEVSITEIINEVVNSTKAMQNEREQVLEMDLPQDSPLVWADYNR